MLRIIVGRGFYPSLEFQSCFSAAPVNWIISKISTTKKLRSAQTKINEIISSATWSTTERREIRNFPYPSVFKLTGRQRLTVKRGIRNVGQFLAAEVTNPGQNESQEMLHSVTGSIKKWV